MSPEEMAKADYDICLEFCHNMKALPSRFGDFIAFLPPPESAEEATEQDLAKPLVIDKSQASAAEVARILGLIESGEVMEASSMMYAVSRRYMSLALLVLVADAFHSQERAQRSSQPWVRVMGCQGCGGNCGSQRSSRCGECDTAWCVPPRAGARRHTPPRARTQAPLACSRVFKCKQQGWNIRTILSGVNSS